MRLAESAFGFQRGNLLNMPERRLPTPQVGCPDARHGKYTFPRGIGELEDSRDECPTPHSGRSKSAES